MHSQHLAGDDPVEKSACIILSGIIDPLLPHLRDLDLQDGEVIGDVLIVINAGVGAVNVHLIKCGQRRELRTVPPGKAHGGLTADDAPALLGGLLQKLVGFVCGANILVYYVAAGHQLPFPAGDHRHGGVGLLHPGPGLDRRPELPSGQGQNYPGQGQQQCAEGRLHRPPGQLVHGIHRNSSFRIGQMGAGRATYDK